MEWLTGRVYNFVLDDVEMGKKDDDFGKSKSPRRGPRGGSRWNPSRTAPSKRWTKRILLALLFGVILYLFFENIPKGDFHDKRRPVYGKSQLDQQGHQVWPYAPPRHKGEFDSIGGRGNFPSRQSEDQKRGGSLSADSQLGVEVYDGPIEFPNLATTLHTLSQTHTTSPSRNILFAASSLKSASNILPMVCRMGQEMRSYVHFALMGHSEVDIEELQKVNAVDEKCHITFHDARVNHQMLSSAKRLRQGVLDALIAINVYMRPDAIIVDGSSAEEPYFLGSMQQKISELGISFIPLPKSSGSSVGWMAKLDSISLSSWNQVHIDIVVSASAGTPGSLIRLLKSLAAADYTGSPLPHLTVELPFHIDEVTERFISTFTWPPLRYRVSGTPNMLSLRKRVKPMGVSQEQADIRFIESFYPTNPVMSHVLVLSPQVEVSTEYFHYLRYTLFQYRHSNTAILQGWEERLFGLALDIPRTKLDGATGFTPPRSQAPRTRGQESMFLWQAPAAHAMLLFGDKWTEMHGLVEQSITISHSSNDVYSFLSQKEFTSNWPGWMEYALRLCRLRGYWMLYPNPADVSSLTTVHTENSMSPEEYSLDGGDQDSEFTQEWKEEQDRNNLQPLVVTIPGAPDELIPFNDMPILNWDGELVGVDELDKRADDYRFMWRKSVGGCDQNELQTQKLKDKYARDLFCSVSEDRA